MSVKFPFMLCSFVILAQILFLKSRKEVLASAKPPSIYLIPGTMIYAAVVVIITSTGTAVGINRRHIDLS